MDVVIPFGSAKFNSRKSSESMMKSYKAETRRDVIAFVDRKPKYDSKTKRFTLNFNGKAKQSSVKNL
jgi:hypothetical protein